MKHLEFRARHEFAPQGDYRLLPFRFTRFDSTRYIVTNDVGEYVLLSRAQLDDFAHHRLKSDTDEYRALKSRHFLFDEDSECALDLLSLKVRTRAARTASFTSLHIFVVTLRCDHSCGYCQVSRQTENKTAFDMSWEDAERALHFTFRTPAPSIKIEFQGGEPLLNFGLVRKIVERALELNQLHRKRIQFVIASNLSQLTDEILEFAREYGILFSTSLDGPASLHNANRPRVGRNSYELTVRGIERIRAALGGSAVSALMTTTPATFSQLEAIVDQYVELGFHNIFLRALSPYGFAVRKSLIRRYDVDGWIELYRSGLDYILAVNRRGYELREDYAAVLLQKMFSPSGTGYVDLQSPAGAGISVIVFNYDGAVYATDEGRMLAEMGDYSYRLGHLATDSYESVMTSEALLEPLEATVLESSPMCTDCAFLPFCGADPVYHSATAGDPVGHKAFSDFCKKQMAILRYLICLLDTDASARQILLGWVP